MPRHPVDLCVPSLGWDATGCDAARRHRSRDHGEVLVYNGFNDITIVHGICSDIDTTPLWRYSSWGLMMDL